MGQQQRTPKTQVTFFRTLSPMRIKKTIEIAATSTCGAALAQKPPAAHTRSLFGQPPTTSVEIRRSRSDHSRFAGRRVLVVEDEYILADDLRQILDQNGFEALGPLPSMAEALGIINNDERIDCAIMDINLRGEVAFPLSSALMKRKIPFLFTTGYGSAQIPSEFNSIARLEKPFMASELISEIETIFRMQLLNKVT